METLKEYIDKYWGTNVTPALVHTTWNDSIDVRAPGEKDDETHSETIKDGTDTLDRQDNQHP